MSEATSIKRKKVTIPQLFQKKLKGEQITVQIGRASCRERV